MPRRSRGIFYLLAFRVERLSFDAKFVVRQIILWYRVITGKGQRTRELTTTCNGRHRRAGNGFRPEETPKKSYEKEDYTMKTLSKKILTVCLALMMCIVMAVPTFAATPESVSPRATLNAWRYYRPYTVYDSRMAVSGSIGDGAEVKLKSNLNTKSQQFIARYAADGSLRIFSRLGYQAANPTQSYTLNVYRSGNWPCTMLRATADNRTDSEVDFHTINSLTFRIYLPGRDVYLTQNGLNANLTWGGYAQEYIKAWVQVAI